jgi:hypothetical protein
LPESTNDVAGELTLDDGKMQEQIAFLTFNIEKAAPLNKIWLQEKKSAPGSMRNNISNRMNSTHYITVHVYENDLLRETFYMDHPLFRRVEYVSEDSQLTTQTIELDNAEFFIRLPVRAKNTRLVLCETTSNASENELITIQI